MEVEQEAQLLGWTPREAFKGNPDKWVDAATFVERGKHMMPILKANNAKLTGEIESLRSQLVGLQSTVEASKESMEALKTFHEESTKAQVTKARAELLEQLKAAKNEGDVDAEVAAVASLSEFDAAQRTVAAEKKAPAPEQKPEKVSPEVAQWMGENPWYGVDQERTGLALGVANKFRAEGVTLQGRAFLEKVAEAVATRFGEPTPPSKVEGSRGGAGGGAGGKDYASLPADAREVCDRQAKKFVGEGRAFKTVKEWNTYFATEYHKGN